MEQILPILCCCFFFYRESAYELMNGQLVLFQSADCAVKNLWLECIFRCAGIVVETALYILSKRCNFGKLEPVKDIVVLKKNKAEITDNNTFWAQHRLIIIPWF